MRQKALRSSIVSRIQNIHSRHPHGKKPGKTPSRISSSKPDPKKNARKHQPPRNRPNFRRKRPAKVVCNFLKLGKFPRLTWCNMRRFEGEAADLPTNDFGSCTPGSEKTKCTTSAKQEARKKPAAAAAKSLTQTGAEERSEGPTSSWKGQKCQKKATS